MYTKTATVQNASGLHARPASEFVNKAKGFPCDIQIYRTDSPEESVNAKSVVMLLTLGIEQGEQVVISAQGEEEEQAVETLVSMIHGGFGE